MGKEPTLPVPQGIIRFALIAAVCVSLFSCSYVKEEEFQLRVSQLRREIKDELAAVNTEVVRLKESHENLRESFAETNSQTDKLDQSLSQLRGDKENLESELKQKEEILKTQSELIKTLSSELSKTKEELNNVNTKLSTLSTIPTELNLLKSEMTKAAEKKELPQEEKDKLYDDALNLYKAQEYVKAIEAFEKFLAQLPQDPLAPNALYWIGESYYSQKKYKEAISYFHRIVTDFPNASKVSAALLKEAYCLDELGMKKESRGALEELAARFPYSEEAKQAQKKLKPPVKKR